MLTAKSEQKLTSTKFVNIAIKLVSRELKLRKGFVNVSVRPRLVSIARFISA